ncbi:hypothetical protein BX600DRAFT_518432 [Xylariales sp. PMI_506]|nr:hypothetical protein BX600DRAFT_518432 [Xylariales sp. PMI_506]
MGAYLSVSTCRAQQNISVSCNFAYETSDNDTFVNLGTATYGTFQGNPDVAGIGLLWVFVSVTIFALIISVVDLGHQFNKAFQWKRKTPEERSQLKHKKKQHTWSDVLESLVQACSDQQIFTGAAYALTLRYYQGCTITAYHYNVVANLLLISCATHLMSVTIIRNYWKYPVLALVRVLCVSGVFVLTGVLLSNQNASSAIPFPTAIPPKSANGSLILLPAICFQDPDMHLLTTLQESTTSANAFFKDSIVDQTPHNFIMGWRWYLISLLFYGAAMIAEFIRFCRRGQSRPGWRATLGKRLHRYVNSGTHLIWLFKWIFFIYIVCGIGISCATVIFSARYIFGLRDWVYGTGWMQLGDNGENPEQDATTFGQLVPIFMSALILFTLLQTVSEKITESANEKHADEPIPNQYGTIAYFDPSHYNLMDVGKYEGKQVIARTSTIQTPGTVDLESAQPWPAVQTPAPIKYTTVFPKLAFVHFPAPAHRRDYPEIFVAEDKIPATPKPVAAHTSSLYSRESSLRGLVNYSPEDDQPEVVVTPPSTVNTTAVAGTARRFCGVSLRWLLLLLAVVVIIIPGAIVGGVIGSRQTQKHGQGGQPTSSPSIATKTVNTAVSTSTGRSQSATTLPTPGLSLAAAVTEDDVNASMQVFYQTHDDATIKYRFEAASGAGYGPTYNLTLSLTPQSNAPFAVTSRYDESNNTVVNFFYVYEADTRAQADIAMSVLACNSTSGECLETSSTIITANATTGVHSESRVAAVWMQNSDTDFRVYYQGTSSAIIEIDGEAAATNGWTTKTLALDAVGGSSLAVLAAPGPNLNVFYASIDTANAAPMMLPWENNGWQTSSAIAISSGSSISGTVAPGWNRAAQLSACYEAATDTYRVYYTEPGAGTIVGYSRNGTTADWTLGTSQSWGKADAGVSAVAMTDQVRLFYLTGGSLEQSVLENGTWTGPGEV